MIRLYIFLALIAAITTNCLAQVPTEWVTARAEVQNNLNKAQLTIGTLWDGKNFCTAFSGNLLLANSNRGYELLSANPPNPPNPQYQAKLLAKIDTMLMMFDTLGYKAVDITINYPLLVNSFPNSHYYLNFYKRVYALARKHGLKILEECQATFADSVFGEKYMNRDILNHYFNPDGDTTTNDTLTTQRYLQEETQMMQTIIDSLAPDYLTLVEEPNTEQFNLFNLVKFKPENVQLYILTYLNNLKPGNVLLGAGAGSWDTLEYVRRIAQTNVDFINYHVYPTNYDYLNNNIFKIDSISKAYNKNIVIGEAWCYKLSDAEYKKDRSNLLASEINESRNVFDYFEPVDKSFILTLVNLSQQAKIEAVSFFNSAVMFGQIKYDSAQYSNLSYEQQANIGKAAESKNMFNLKLGNVGIFARNTIANICSTASDVQQDNITQNNLSIKQQNGTIELVFSKPLETDCQIIISDILGREIQKIFVNKGNINYEINHNFGNGMYLVEIIENNSIYIKKLLIY